MVCVYLFKKKTEKDCYDNIDTSSLTNSKKFWKTVKQIFGCKLKSKNSITFVEGTNIIQEEGELAKTFNEFFVSIVKNLGINENLLPLFSSEATVESIITKFENHPSIVTIRNCFDKNSTFSVKEIFKTEVIKEIKILTLIKNHFLAIFPLR